MNVQLPVRLDKAGFLTWVQGREERYELAKGRVIMMVGASRAHGMLVLNIASCLRTKLDARDWTVIAEFEVDAEPETHATLTLSLTAPTAMQKTSLRRSRCSLLRCSRLPRPTLTLATKQRNTCGCQALRLTSYFRRPNQKHGFQFAMNEASAPGPTVLAGPEATAAIPQLRLQLSLSEVYAGVPTT